MTTNIEPSAFLTVAEVGRYLHISLSAAYELTRRGDFPVARFGGSVRIPRAAFLEWVDARISVPTRKE